MYPLNLTRADGVVVGHAVANDEDEHRALSEAGYLPAFEAPDPTEADAQGHTVASVRAALDLAGVAYDRRFGLAKLLTLLPV